MRDKSQVESLRDENKELRKQLASAKAVIEGQAPHIMALERQLTERTKQFEELIGEFDGFLYTAGHVLRRPRRTIHGFVELLKDHEGFPDSLSFRDCLNKIYDGASLLETVVDRLLVLGRVVRTECRKVPTNLTESVNRAKAEVMAGVKDRKVEWRIADLPTIPADPYFLREVFTNLFSNALKFTREREPAVVEVTCSSGSTEIVVCVRDNGVGFNEKSADRLFRIWSQLHHSDEYEGEGFGLAIVRRAIERQGGKVWAEGNIDRGAAFYFSLPLVSEHV